MKKFALMAAAVTLALSAAAPPASAQIMGRFLQNRATVEQVGRDNGAAVAQNGVANRAGVTQRGNAHTGVVRQNGNNNAMGVVQNGAANTANVTQTNNNNQLCLMQRGNGLTADVQQNGNDAAWYVQNNNRVARLPTGGLIFRACAG